MSPIELAIVGLGKIARDQHIPVVSASTAFELVAVASPHGRLEGIPSFTSLEALLDADTHVTAVALCTPPQIRYEMACLALRRGKHVLLEKPPGVTVGEVLSLAELARQHNVTLFTSWHSRHAPAVEPARRWLAARSIRSITIAWKENVRVWHPGQRWIWQAGGLGVFDPGINALSILTHLAPEACVLREAEMSFPANCATPIAAHLRLTSATGISTRVELDFLHEGPPCWDIDFDTDAGRLHLSMGGMQASVNGQALATPESGEYGNLYSHFASLVHEARSDVDVAPLQLVADAFLNGRRRSVDPFVE